MGMQQELGGQGLFAGEVDWLVGTEPGVWKGPIRLHYHSYLRMRTLHIQC